MRATPTDRCVARLQPGDVKRVPRSGGQLVGYYIACPACGRVRAVTASEQIFVEVDGGPQRMAPGVVCERPECAKVFAIEGNEFIVSA